MKHGLTLVSSKKLFSHYNNLSSQNQNCHFLTHALTFGPLKIFGLVAEGLFDLGPGNFGFSDEQAGVLILAPCSGAAVISGEHSKIRICGDIEDLFAIALGTGETFTLQGQKLLSGCAWLPAAHFTKNTFEAFTQGGLKLTGNTLAAKLVSRQIQEFFTYPDDSDPLTGQAIADGMQALLTVASQSGGQQSRQAGNDKSSLSLIADFVAENLFDPDLGPNLIADHIGFSRAKLYRMAAPLGGIGRYIRERRLDYAYEQLRRGSATMNSISELSYNLGFGSESAFRRQFKSRFGISPKHAARDPNASINEPF